MSKIVRVFPRETSATPDDALAFVGPPGLFVPDADGVHISVAFSWDLPEAERLARAWAHVGPVKIGGPGAGTPGGEFEPGMYLKTGYTITSRGCPNKCWFCNVWKLDGTTHELEIRPGFNVQDDNLLACSQPHIEAVFAMLAGQRQRAIFGGGLEARLFEEWHAKELLKLNPSRMFFAYDTPDDYGPLKRAAEILTSVSWPANDSVRCFVLVGWPKDTEEAALKRMEQVLALGFMPFSMLWRGKDGKFDKGWRKFQRKWARPSIIRATHPIESRENPDQVDLWR